MSNRGYRICPNCGASLDPGESERDCECQIVDDCSYCDKRNTLTNHCGFNCSVNETGCVNHFRNYLLED